MHKQLKIYIVSALALILVACAGDDGGLGGVFTNSDTTGDAVSESEITPNESSDVRQSDQDFQDPTESLGSSVGDLVFANAAAGETSESNNTVDTELSSEDFEQAEEKETFGPSSTTISADSSSAQSDVEAQNAEFLDAGNESSNNGRSGRQNIDSINEKITLASLSATPKTIKREEYTLGGGDVVEISVFQVEELSRTVRVSNDGYVMLPLLGTLFVEGMTVDQFSEMLTQKLAADYLHDPHVSAFVTEFQSHQVAVMGAVENPSIYNITEPRTILQMIAMAGGLTGEAGDRVFVRTKKENNQGQRVEESLVISLNSLVDQSSELDFSLGKGDSIMVPKGGTVFVEGAVEEPGAYTITGDMNILKALTVAGGLSFEAETDEIQVYRETPSGEPAVYTTTLESIREEQDDIQLVDGDIVIVDSHAMKQILGGAWEGVKGIFGFSARVGI